jgi:DNA repair exonuclease SbcCD ATPase subunit
MEAKENTLKALVEKVRGQGDTIVDQKKQIKDMKLLNGEEQERASKIQEQLPQLFQLIKTEETKSLNCKRELHEAAVKLEREEKKVTALKDEIQMLSEVVKTKQYKIDSLEDSLMEKFEEKRRRRGHDSRRY